jgi:glycosyltransferase involved in cell wall biosynthesis
MKFSVITITRNSEQFLEETMESVLSQDCPDLEYILVDGGSTDGTLDLIRLYAARDRRIRWVSEPDAGISDAMNKGIRMARGDVIAHLHSDDRYPAPDVLSRVSAAFNGHPDALWLTGGQYIIDDQGSILQEIRVRPYSYRKLVRCNCILHPATFVRREGFRRAGLFDVSRKYAMDYDLWLRLGALGDPLLIDAPLASFRLHEGSLSTVETEKAFDEALAVRKELMRNQPVIFFFHHLYYLLKKRRNSASVRRVRRGNH